MRAGIDRFNVSIDSLQRDRFFEMTRRDALPRVLRRPRGARARSPRRTRSRSTPSRCAASPRTRCCRSRASPASTPTRCASSSSCRSTPTTPGRRDQVLTGDEIRAAIDAVWPLEPEPREPQRDRARLPLRRRQGRIGFINPVSRAVLRRLQPHPPDRRRPAADVPVLAQRDRPARAAARGRERRRPRADRPRRGVAQGAQAPRQRRGLRAAGALDVADRRLRRRRSRPGRSPARTAVRLQPARLGGAADRPRRRPRAAPAREHHADRALSADAARSRRTGRRARRTAARDVLLRAARERHALGRVARVAVEQRADQLGHAQAHLLDRPG